MRNKKTLEDKCKVYINEYPYAPFKLKTFTLCNEFQNTKYNHPNIINKIKNIKKIKEYKIAKGGENIYIHYIKIKI